MNKNYRIGLLVLFAFAILYYGLLFLKGRDLFATCNVYQISYPVNKNLSVSTPVQFKGHKVGKIVKIEMSPGPDYSTLFTIEIDKKYPLTNKSKVMLANLGVVEGNALELELNEEGTLLTKHDLIIGQLHPNFDETDLNLLTTRVTALVSNLMHVLDSVNSILHNFEKSSHFLHTTIQHVHHSINTISNNMVAISTPLADPITGIPSLLPTLCDLLGEIKSLPFKEFSYKTTHLLNNMETLLQSISSNQGTLGRLIHDPTLYNNLNYSAENLNALLLNFKKQPSRYVHLSLFNFGRKP